MELIITYSLLFLEASSQNYTVSYLKNIDISKVDMKELPRVVTY